MIDYISASSFLGCKDSPNFSNCEPEAVYNSGWQRFLLNGCKKLEVDWNEDLRMMRLKGSIMYFWQGHNLTFDKVGFVDAIEYISNLLEYPVWKFDVNAFEYGKIIEVEGNPKDYIKHHSVKASAKMNLYEKSKDKGRLKGWENSDVRLKMYDAKPNFDIKADIDKEAVLQASGYADSNILKWEAHYKKPEYFTGGRSLLLADLVDKGFIKAFNEDLFYQYKKLIPMKNYIEPTNKKDLSTSDIIMLELLQGNLDEGITADEVQKMLYARINSIPDVILSKSDKDARKRQIKGLISKIQEEPESKWDLSNKLKAVLEET